MSMTRLIDRAQEDIIDVLTFVCENRKWKYIDKNVGYILDGLVLNYFGITVNEDEDGCYLTISTSDEKRTPEWKLIRNDKRIDEIFLRVNSKK